VDIQPLHMVLKAGQMEGAFSVGRNRVVKTVLEARRCVFMYWKAVSKVTFFKTYGKDTLRPVTIKQIIDAQQPHPDAEFKLDGHEMTQVTPLRPFFLNLDSLHLTDHLRRPNPHHLHPSHKHNLQTRRRHRPH
jgi:hypothetical protein